ncbi:hypothetical protein K8I61_19025 [bacterium]|nr:hypothetical protein [bacterium]
MNAGAVGRDLRRALVAANVAGAVALASLIPLFVWPDAKAGAAGTITAIFGAIMKGGLAATALAYAGIRAFDLFRARRWRSFGWPGFLPGAIAMLFAALLIVRVTVQVGTRESPHADDRAKELGTIAEKALKAYHKQNGHYTDNIAELAAIDERLDDRGGIEFHFDVADENAYRFTTHAKGSARLFRFVSEGVPFLGGVKFEEADPLAPPAPPLPDPY